MKDRSLRLLFSSLGERSPFGRSAPGNRLELDAEEFGSGNAAPNTIWNGLAAPRTGRTKPGVLCPCSQHRLRADPRCWLAVAGIEAIPDGGFHDLVRIDLDDLATILEKSFGKLAAFLHLADAGGDFEKVGDVDRLHSASLGRVLQLPRTLGKKALESLRLILVPMPSRTGLRVQHWPR